MGADPGPACYRKGGEEPTVTDAYIINGLINPEYLLGGKMRIYRDLAVRAVSKIAERYKMPVEEAAEGIIKIANENAANAVRVVSVQRGYDPRDFTLIAYGGSGPMFAPFMAEELEIKRIVVPCVQPGVFSAWGMLLLDVKHDSITTEVIPLEEKEMGRINETYRNLEREVLEVFEEEGVKGVELMRFGDMRYQGQEHTVKVPVRSKTSVSDILKDFEEYHEREYSYKLDAPAEIVNFHVSGIAKTERIELKEKRSTTKSMNDAIKEEREVFLKGSKQRLPVLAKELIPADVKGKGPVVIEDPTSTIIVLESQSFVSDRFGNIIITREEA
jgi:N-methylhydantoinase A